MTGSGFASVSKSDNENKEAADALEKQRICHFFWDGKILHPAGTVAKSLSAAVTAAMVAVSLSAAAAVAIAIAAARIWAVRITGAVT